MAKTYLHNQSPVWLVISSLALLLAACAGSSTENDQGGNKVLLQEYSDRIKAGVPPLSSDNKLYVYETIDYRSHTLRTSKTVEKLYASKTTTMPEHPYLAILDSDHDGAPDQFVYQEVKGKPSVEFGFLFDLNKDGKVDYFVFNGGPMMNKDLKRIMWMNYHVLDSNFDGRIDILVYNDIDLNGDHEADNGVTAWIYDNNFDGSIDSAEYLGYTPIFPIGGAIWFPEEGSSFKKAISAEDNTLLVKKVTGEKTFHIGDEFFGFQAILDDLNETIQ